MSNLYEVVERKEREKSRAESWPLEERRIKKKNRRSLDQVTQRNSIEDEENAIQTHYWPISRGAHPCVLIEETCLQHYN